MLFLSCSLCCACCSVFICTERICCSCACLRDVCQADGVYLLNYTITATQRYSECFFTSLGTLFFSSWHRVCSRIFHHLWKYPKWPAESDTLCLLWRMAVWRHVGKFSVSAADSLPNSRPEGDRRRDKEENPSPHSNQLILLHRQIRVG